MHHSLQRADDSPPQWVLGAVEEGSETSVSSGGYPIRVLAGERFALLSTAVPAATELGADELERITRESYLRLLDHASRLKTSHFVRVWNLIPGILEALGELQHRYLAFNAGRFHAYRVKSLNAKSNNKRTASVPYPRPRSPTFPSRICNSALRWTELMLCKWHEPMRVSSFNNRMPKITVSFCF